VVSSAWSKPLSGTVPMPASRSTICSDTAVGFHRDDDGPARQISSAASSPLMP
jgi:hypothetical protein